MDPLLWGPCIWKTLFSISFNCTTTDIPQITKLLKLLEKVIPCPTCRTHYKVNREKSDKFHPLTKQENVYKWLWYTKMLINNHLKIKNTELKYIKMRYDTFGHDICDTELCDVLVLISLTIKNDDVDKFHQFIFILGNLIRFIRGQLPALLQCVEDAYPSTILNVANMIRKNYGFSTRETSKIL
jgi:hypothetical protein